MDTFKGWLKVMIIFIVVIGGMMFLSTKMTSKIEYQNAHDPHYVKPKTELEKKIDSLIDRTLKNTLYPESAENLKNEIAEFIADTIIKHGSDVPARRFDVLQRDYISNIDEHLQISIELREKEEKERIKRQKILAERAIQLQENASLKGKSFQLPKQTLRSLSESQIKRMFAGILQLGDPKCMAIGMPGRYKVSTTKSNHGETMYLYTRGNNRYDYIVITNGVVDYISF